MKKHIFSFCLCIFSFFALVSCHKDEETVLDVAAEKVEIDSVGGGEIISVLSNKEWKTEILEDWVTVEQTVQKGNGSLKIIVAPMETSSPRTAIVTVSAGGDNVKTITVFQSPSIKKSGLADVATYVSGVTSSTVMCRLSILRDYGNSVSEKGFCISTTEKPTIENKKYAIEDTVLLLNGLQENTTYYIRSYAINRKGVSYGRQLQFTTKKVEEAEGRIAKGFLVAPDQQVYFSQGNLQYNTTTKEWRFALSQTDKVATGWIDLFGWGTSGYNETNPETTEPTYSLYGQSVNGNFSSYDWGVYNSIGGWSADSWRTLTEDEWTYLLLKRPHAIELVGLATVNGYTGLVILPDSWEQPDDCSFAPSDVAFSLNNLSSAEWSKMESLGAVFLPAAGNRYSENVTDLLTSGSYWSATESGDYSAYSVYFKNTKITLDRSYKVYGRSVRLVQNL